MKTDAILPFTRLIASFVVFFLITAFIILFFMPERTGELFAWKITPSMSSMFVGAAYLGGAWILARVAFGKHWHRVSTVFPAVTIFSIAMLLSTILHWDRFALGQLPFYTWLALYIVAPFLIPALWIYNNHTASDEPETSDAVLPSSILLTARLTGIIILIIVIIGFLYPALPISVWPWTLTPLTARVLCGWFSVIAILPLFLSADPRWTAWRHMVEGLFIALFLTLTALVINRTELTPGIFNWFTGCVSITLLILASLYLRMENIRRKS